MSLVGHDLPRFGEHLVSRGKRTGVLKLDIECPCFKGHEQGHEVP